MTLFDALLSLRDDQRRAKATEPVVVGGADRPWEESAHGRLKWYLHPALPGPPHAYTIYTQEIPSGHRSGRQQTQGGMLFYLLRGELATTINDELYRWRAGDLLTLPILEHGVIYQHFNVQELDAVLLSLEANAADPLGVDRGCGFELLEPAGPIGVGGVRRHEGRSGDARKDAWTLTDAPAIDPGMDIQYHRDIERWKWIRERHDRGRLLVRGDDMPWEQNVQGRVRYYLNPEFKQNALRDWTFFLHDIKTHTGSHRHQGGILIYVVDGEGYSLVDGVRHDWSTGDLIMLPIQPGGVEHEHHNLRPGATCQWLAAFYWPWWELVASEFTQMRAHPDYQPVPEGGGTR